LRRDASCWAASIEPRLPSAPWNGKFQDEESRYDERGLQMSGKALWVLGMIYAVLPFQAAAQCATDIAILQGLAPVSALSSTAECKAAQEADYRVTGGIQISRILQPAPLPFAHSSRRRCKIRGSAEILSKNQGLSAAYRSSRPRFEKFRSRPNAMVKRPTPRVIPHPWTVQATPLARSLRASA
jgi:hypothetical protein